MEFVARNSNSAGMFVCLHARRGRSANGTNDSSGHNTLSTSGLAKTPKFGKRWLTTSDGSF